MPQVPDSFVPSATVSPLGVSPVSAQPVQPMRNAAPEQMEQSGAAVSKLGDESIDIGERIRNQLDNAMAKQAETGFLQKVVSITSGDGSAANPGYLNLKGQDAINGYQDAATAIAKAKQDGQDGLASDFQKSMYNRVTSQHLLSFGREMADHNFHQGQQFYTEASVNRANAYATLASNAATSYGQTDADGNQSGDFFKYTQVAEQNTLDAVQRSKGAPAGSDVANAALLNLHTQVGTGALVQMMDARTPYSKVQSVYDDMKTRGMFTLQAQDTLGKMVKSYSDQESTRTAVSQSLSDAVRASQGQATTSTGTPDYQFPIKGATVTAQSYDPEQGGVAVNVPMGSSIQAPANGKVTQVGRDDDGNFQMKIEHADGSVTSFSGLTASNVKVGDQVERGESVATSGAADGKTPSVLWSLTNAAGTNVDPTKAGLAPVDLTKVTDEKVLGNALDSLRKQVTDPYLQQQATNEMETMVRHNQQMVTAAKAQTLQQATDAFYSYANSHHGSFSVNAIPASLQGQIPPEALSRFKELAAGPVGGPAIDGAIDTRAGFILHPETQTVANVNAIRTQVTPTTYLSLLSKAQELATNPRVVIEAGAINDRIKYFANQAGIKDSDDKGQTPGDKQNYTALVYRVTNAIDQIKAQNNGKATGDQVDKAINTELAQRAVSYQPHRAWNPLVWTHIESNDPTMQRNFQMPPSTTGVVPGQDGKMHYTDGRNDLGVVQ